MVHALPFAAVLAGGLREPWAFALVACGFWAWAALQPAPRLTPWLPWLGVLILSAAVSSQPALALPPLARWTLAVAVWGLAAGRAPRWWGKAAAALSVVVCLSALASVRGLSSFYSARDVSELATGLFPGYYNYTAFVAGAGAAAAIALGRWWLLAALPLAPFAALTKPRAMLLGLLAAGGALALRRGWWKPVALAVLLGCGVLLLKRDRAAVAKRPQIWKAAAQVAADKPLLGEGPGNFEAGFRRHAFPATHGRVRYGFTTAYAHGEPFQVLAETGLAGFTALWWALGCVLSGGPAPLLAAFTAMSAQLCVDNMWQVPAFLLLWISALAGLSAPAGPGDKRLWRGLCAAGAALALAAWLVPARVVDWEQRGRAALAAGRVAEAEDAYARAEKLHPTNAFYVVVRAELARSRGAWPEVRALAARALELEPEFAQARLLAAEAAWRLGDSREAEEHLRLFEAIAPVVGERGYEKLVVSKDAARHALVAKMIRSRP